MYGTHAMSVPSHVTGFADALVADTTGAAMNPEPSASAAMSFMGLSVDSPPPFASTIVAVGAAGRRRRSRLGAGHLDLERLVHRLHGLAMSTPVAVPELL